MCCRAPQIGGTPGAVVSWGPSPGTLRSERRTSRQGRGPVRNQLCGRRTALMTPYRQAAGRWQSQTNEDCARCAARRQAAAARWAVAAHDVGPELSSTPVWRRQWIDVLRRRAADDVSTLSGLAATVSPPMTKDAVVGQLRRACRFEAGVAAGIGSDGVAAAAPAIWAHLTSAGDRAESCSCAGDFIGNPGAPGPDGVW